MYFFPDLSLLIHMNTHTANFKYTPSQGGYVSPTGQRHNPVFQLVPIFHTELLILCCCAKKDTYFFVNAVIIVKFF